MNQAEYEELVLLMAYQLEELADNEPPYRGITRNERASLVRWLAREFRRLSRAGGDLHGCCIEVKPASRIVVVPPAPVSWANIPPVTVRPVGGMLMNAPGRPAVYYGTAKPHHSRQGVEA